MCLYGHDLDESVSPVEAALSWVIGASRLMSLESLADNQARTDEMPTSPFHTLGNRAYLTNLRMDPRGAG